MCRFLIVFVLLLAGCSTPQIVEREHTGVGISFEDETVAIAANKTASDSIALDGIVIRRTLYTGSASQPLVYEHAVALAPYLFHYDVKRSLDIIFKSRNVIQIERVGNLGFYAAVFSAEKPLYVIAQNENQRGIAMLYGLTKQQMIDIALQLDIKSLPLIDAMEEGRVLPDSPAAFVSRWNAQMIILDGLLERMGGNPFKFYKK